ncbi:hypothetical protein [Radiobacillus deserti]|nr:hypothetical protein [Radiobacillus deserti]
MKKINTKERGYDLYLKEDVWDDEIGIKTKSIKKIAVYKTAIFWIT